ncbi:MAG TPA: hypothetical protein VH255_10025 [Verrucomicrobiae bacterium]|jgi:hypothetical protein|nr:hypothetical protein [Verrucomicrobiae bacterium]
MSSAFAALRPSERRLVILVGTVLFIVINWVWVVPHFSDWSATSKRMSDARWTIDTYQKEIAKLGFYQSEVNQLEGEGASVPLEDQAIQFARTIQSQAAQSRISVLANSRPTVQTNQFFIEQFQTISVQGEEKNLVDFLYNLGAGNSLIRVRGLSMHPDAPRQLLAASVTLVASYQKNLTARAASTPAAPTPAAPPKATTAAPPGVPPISVRTVAPDKSNLSTNKLKSTAVPAVPVKK